MNPAHKLIPLDERRALSFVGSLNSTDKLTARIFSNTIINLKIVMIFFFMIERQVRYNIHTYTGEQEFERHKWTFMVINTPTEIERIRERIFRQLKPIRDGGFGKDILPDSDGLHYDCFWITSEFGKIEEDKIYASKKIKLDRDLFERDEISLNRYLNSILQGRK